ncbi:MAG: AAA family ATPase [Desulfotignum sp.]|nr:AAA family ATPase [Desulfotignum sp.]MCF8087548.1 AAA family ATPase [Desulfotignum sp.]MCF8136331.1 AAA family ATPase [Desulfotignum sp.]
MDTIKISIAGDLGSGKSTVAKILAEKLNCEQYSTGSIQREIAKKMNMSTMDLNESMKHDKSIDAKIDEFNKSLNKSRKSFVIDSRMAWFFIPESFKVFLQIDPDIAATRVLRDNIRESEVYDNIEEAKKELALRKKIENERFRNLYNVDCSDMDNYNIVIDTSCSNPETIADKIIELYESWLIEKEITKYWLPPKILIPTQKIQKLGRSQNQTVYVSIKKDGFNDGYPVETILCKGTYFILNGHLRVSASIVSGTSLIPVVISGDDKDFIFGVSIPKFISTEFKMVNVYDWEECHDFHFHSYPDTNNIV